LDRIGPCPVACQALAASLLSRHIRPMQAVVLAVFVAMGPTLALAGAGEQSLSIEPGFGLLDQDGTRYGGSLGATYAYRLGDRFALRASAAAGAYYDNDAAYSTQALASIAYTFDVLRYVPWASVGLGGIATFGPDVGECLDPIAEVAAGLDILHSRSFSYGLFVRYESLFQETSYAAGGLRLNWHWGFF